MQRRRKYAMTLQTLCGLPQHQQQRRANKVFALCQVKSGRAQPALVEGDRETYHTTR